MQFSDGRSVMDLSPVYQPPLDLSARQRQVLEHVLDLLVEEGDSFSMSAVAGRANCSKETLYKWFGDREGLLISAVRYKAMSVQAGEPLEAGLSYEELARRLQAFAANWLRVISTNTSLALNRVAIAHAGSQKSGLGKIVLENGRFAIGERLKPLLEAGRSAGFLHFEEAEEAFQVLFGLVARDVQIRLLLGDRIELNEARINADAKMAVDRFFSLFGSAKYQNQLNS